MTLPCLLTVSCRYLHPAVAIFVVLCVLDGASMAQAAVPSEVKGEPFPVGSIMIVTVITIVCAATVSALAIWKSSTVENFLETIFELAGRRIGSHPWKCIAIAVLFAMACAGGMGLQDQELDPAVLWVPTGSVALDHKEYVAEHWPARAFPDIFVAVPSSGTTGENMLTPAYVQMLFRDYQKLLAITVDGDEVVKANEDKFAAEFSGTWTYNGSGGTRANCLEMFPGTCSASSILAVFDYDPGVIASLDASAIRTRIKQWEQAPLHSQVRPGSIKTFEIDSVLGGISRDANGDVVGAKTFRVSMMNNVVMKETKPTSQSQVTLTDPINMLWGADAVCILGFEEKHPYTEDSCSKPTGLVYYGNFMRSFSDEFGDAIKNDIKNIIIAYYLIIIFLFVNLGKRDSVHSMIAMSVGSVVCIGLSYAMSQGLGGYFQVKTNPLNNNIPFLLLGLGVDDSFVLASEFTRHSLQNPHLSIEERIAKTARTGGISILVTSVTDALAFLIGSSTKLPALSGFCVYAGLGVLGCFLMVFFVFLPLLAVNAQRAAANRFDCLCCMKAKEEHLLESPQGCCSCIPCCPKIQPGDNFLKRNLMKFGEAITKTLFGRIFTIVIFTAIFAVGLAGLVQMETEFRLEWFFPSDSYVNKFTDVNDQYFNRGVSFNVYQNGIDIYSKQSAMKELSSYLTVQDFVVQDSVQDWYAAFNAYAENPLNSCQISSSVQFYACMWKWYSTSNSATVFRRNIQWASAECNAENAINCNPSAGIRNARIPAMLKSFENGLYRYNVYRTMREDMKSLFGDGDAVYPYSMSFLYWEENGVIMEELIRNLIIAAGIIVIILFLLIPDARIAAIVAFVICISIVEVVGFAHWWSLTFNGTATIYFLICVGLAVDYSAHIAHVFKDSRGTSSERAILAMGRIGPSVFQAVMSTLLAVIVIGFSKSYVFEVFFKILFLVTVLAGVHGMWLLPTLLSMFGGDAKNDGEGSLAPIKVAPADVALAEKYGSDAAAGG